MLVVWNRAASFNGSSKVSTWIFAIAYRKALKALRRWDEPLEDPRAAKSRVESAPRARAAGGRSADARRAAARAGRAVGRAAVGGRPDLLPRLGYREIAQIVDCPVDTVKTRMFHARRRLKRAARRAAGGLAVSGLAARRRLVNGQVVHLQPDAHRALQELLPWYASGALDAAEREPRRAAPRRLRARARPSSSSSGACRQRMQRCRWREPIGGRRTRPRAVAPAHRRRRPRRRRAAPAASARCARARGGAGPCAAQFAVIAGLVALLLMPVERYRGLGDAAAARGRPATAQVVVRFRADASEREIRAGADGQRRAHRQRADVPPTPTCSRCRRRTADQAVATLRAQPR